MNLRSLFGELKRRNIYRVGVVYAITGWVVVQIASVASEAFGAPAWVMKMLITLVVLGFPVALVFAWAFEITPDGIQRTAEVESDESVSRQTGRKLNYWIIGMLAGAVVLLLAERIWLAGSSSGEVASPTTAEAEPSLAVLPFLDISQADDQEWFSDGMTEELLNSLARTDKFHLASRTSSFAFKNSDLPITAIADSLNVKHILEGSVRRSGEEMRITAQLIRAEDDSHLWSNTYDVGTDSVFAVQRSIADNITSALDVYLDESERREMLNFGTRDVQAYELYLKAKRAYWNVHQSYNSPGSHWTVADLATQALVEDSTFAGAYYLRQDPYVHYLVDNAGDPPDSTLQTQEALNQIRRDLARASRHAATETERKFYQVQQSIMSDDWSDLSGLIDHQLQNPEYLIRDLGFADAFIIALGRAHEFRELLFSTARNNSLNQAKWLAAFRLAAAEKDTAFFSRHLEERIEEFSNPRFARGEQLLTYLRMGAFDQAMEVVEKQYLTSFEKKWARFLVKSARGDTSVTSARVEELVSGLPDEVNETVHLQVYHIAGEYETANRIGGRIDASPLGPMQLIVGSASTGMLLTFDSEATPNFEARMQELGIDIDTLSTFGEKLRSMGQNDD
ncbi:MAG: hypothetical protein U5K31_08075 [Balneolaceae bacterium]|nr:hypothetical protein [Balneolaceae bacterium]